MGWIDGNQKVVKYADYNSIVKELAGDLNEIEAKITLAKFLKTNLGFTFEMISGVKLLPVQEVILKTLMIRDNALIVASRGWSKSYLISIFSILYSIFFPEGKMCLISLNFRGSRRILETSEKIVNHKKAELLRQCFPNALKKSNDMYRWILPNGSEIFALPLSNGDGLRGTRSTCVAVDEGNQISKSVQDEILRPFLTIKHNLQEEMEVRLVENELISKGIITEADRISFPKNKYFVFSSASYTFEHLYDMYQKYIENCINPLKDKEPPTYFVMRASYESLPNDSIFDMTQINSAKADGGENTEYFKREYKSIFSSGNSGYYSAKSLHQCTIKDGDFPTVQLKGEKDCQYILTIDPSYAQNKGSDFFVMAIYMLIPQERRIILVHTYAKAGTELKNHFLYLVYLLTYFNIVFVCIDDSGSEFIAGFNESTIAKERNINLGFLDCDFDKDEYLEQISNAKKQYNQTSRKFVYGQRFGHQTIRKMNEHLQNQIEAKKVWFASRIQANEMAFKKACEVQLPFTFKDKNDQDFGLIDFIEDQDNWIAETKNQTALIEVRSTVLGILQFDLPQNLRRSSEANRIRKDCFTCVLLAGWASKIYYDIMFTESAPQNNTFMPFFVNTS